MRKRMSVAVLVLIAVAVGGAAAFGLLTGDVETPAGGSASRCDPQAQRALDAWEARGFSGAIAVSTDGRFECVAGFGVADDATGRPVMPDTVFSIGSVSKTFAAAAVLGLDEEGRLRLSDRAGKLVPGLRGPARKVTVEQLLLHTSGLPVSHAGDTEPLTRDQAVAAISALKPAFAPGRDYLYSNAGYTLLALIVDRLAPGGFRERVASQVLPLPDGRRAGGFWNGEPAADGQLAVGYTEDGPAAEQGRFSGPHWALAGNGDLAMSVRDLAAWTHAALSGKILPDGVAERMTSGGFEQGDGQPALPGWVAYDEQRFGVPLLVSAGGGGSGHQAVVVWSPRTKQVIAATSNRATIGAEDLVRAIGPALLAGEPVPLPRRSGQRVDTRQLRAVAGTYELVSGGSLAVSARSGGLAIVPRGRDAVAALLPVGDAFDAETVAAHERRVGDLLGGRTDEGRRERELLARSIGPIENVRVDGTVLAGQELRTYVTVTGTERPEKLWYALDEQGGIAAAEASVRPPAVRVVPVGGRRFELEDPAGSSAPFTVRFGENALVLETAPGRPTASRTARKDG